MFKSGLGTGVHRVKLQELKVTAPRYVEKIWSPYVAKAVNEIFSCPPIICQNFPKSRKNPPL